MREPASLLEAHALRAEAACPRRSLSPPRHGIVSVSGYQRSARSQSALLAAAADDGDLAAGVQHAEHQPHLPLAPPAVRLASGRLVVLDLAREQRAALLELAQHVAAVRGVLLQVRRSAGGRGGGRCAACARGGAAGPRRARGRRSTRRASAPPRAGGRARPGRSGRRAGSRARGAVAARRSRSGRAAGSRGAGRCRSTSVARSVEQLRAHGDAPRLLDADLTQAAARSTSPMVRARRCAARSNLSRSCHASCGSGVNRLTCRTPSARSAFRSARPTKRSPTSSGRT